jgi:phage recombination protein Bet
MNHPVKAALQNTAIAAFSMDETELIDVLQSSLYPGAALGSIKMVVNYCRAAHLDPMQKPVHIVPIWDSKAKSMRDVIMPGIGLYRTQAARSGNYAGVSDAEFGPDITEKIGGVEITYPQWCRTVVKRLLPSGQIVEFAATERWKENYAVKGGQEKSIAPNAMWQRRPYGQIAKCSEAQALRKAFPEFGAQPTADEMEGKEFEIEINAEPAKPNVETPRRKSEGGATIDGQSGEVIDQPAGDAQQKTQAAPDKKTPPAGDAKTNGGNQAPASAGLINVVKAKIAAASLNEADAFKKFGIESFDGIKTSMANDIIAWTRDPQA